MDSDTDFDGDDVQMAADMWLNGGRGKYGGSGERMGKGRRESWEATKQKLIAGRWLNSPQLQTPHKSIFLGFCTNQHRGQKQIVLVSFVKNRPSNQLCTVQNILHISIKSIKKLLIFMGASLRYAFAFADYYY